MKKFEVISLKERLEKKDEIIVLPGVYDALSARIAQNVGFNAAFQTGYGTSATLLGMPDFGFLNAGETIDNARRIINSVDIPILVDIDTGYGNPLNVWRMVTDLEKLGAGGIFLEDQVWPKRCGHMKGKSVISKEDYVQKLKAAIDARKSKDFIIVARTDSLAQYGIDEAIERGKEFQKIGADVIFIEAPKTLEEMKKITAEIDAPLLANMIEEGITPNLPVKDLEKLGFRMVVFPLSALYSSTYAIKNVFLSLQKTGMTKNLKKKMITFKEFNDFVNLPKYNQLEKKYS
ncbi:MAG TPA: isocitrate lyase/PEP mutase family protein [Nitrososphaeraceae archaeon]|nr:isocitrate lyase/PEP mutase family protein [Nitrososphaeraceae archaeon]